jgi:hypothetical protein
MARNVESEGNGVTRVLLLYFFWHVKVFESLHDAAVMSPRPQTTMESEDGIREHTDSLHIDDCAWSRAVTYY